MGNRRTDEHEGRYSNHFRIGFNSFEFIFEFGQTWDGAAPSLPHTRILTGPAYAKVFSGLLAGTLADYEKNHGTIPDIASDASGED